MSDRFYFEEKRYIQIVVTFLDLFCLDKSYLYNDKMRSIQRLMTGLWKQCIRNIATTLRLLLKVQFRLRRLAALLSAFL